MMARLFSFVALAAVITPTFAAAEPISLAIASTISAVISAGGTFTFLGLSGIGAIAASVAVRAALGYAINALTSRGNRVSGGYTVNSIGPALPHAVIYGETKVGGAVFYQATTASGTYGYDEYLHRCIAFAGHEIESFESVWFNDEEITFNPTTGAVTAPAKWVGFARIKTHLGADDQTADSDLVAEVTEWTTNHRARGVAYLYIRFAKTSSSASDTAYKNGLPVVRAVIRGKKVYDQRSDATAWSANPALCLRDYVTADYGLAEGSSQIDDALFTTAADICDETVSGSARYTCNGAFLLDAAPDDIVRTTTASMGGMFWYQLGTWACRAAAYVSPTLIFDEDDLRSNLQISTKHSRLDNFNVVRGVYRGPETNYQETDFTEVTDATYVAEDNGVAVATDIPLLFTETDAMAQRIAEIALRRNRKQITVTAAFGLRALDVMVGDTIMLTNARAGWTNKIFECVDWRLGLTGEMDLQVNMILREASITVFGGVESEPIYDRAASAIRDRANAVIYDRAA
jgi:hypothetical protein